MVFVNHVCSQFFLSHKRTLSKEHRMTIENQKLFLLQGVWMKFCPLRTVTWLRV
uniref:Uncharacterized protein n=1 Tax=Anguilla anguilla TaxID=7936 RepID=A0A0E9RUI7_ANGAN